MSRKANGRTALVTGGASGFGTGICECLAAEGYKVAVADRDSDGAERVAKRLGAKFAGVFAVAMDVTDEAKVQKAVQETTNKGGPIDVLVNCAGVLARGKILESTAKDWDDVSRVNVAGVLNCVRAVAPAMAERRSGRIVNISSISAVKGSGLFGGALYSATKASVSSLTMGLARELAPSGVTVNAISPGAADTPMTNRYMSDDLRAKLLARIPAGRFCTPEDIGNAVVFLASDRASYITGAVIPIDGGLLTL